MDAVKVIKKSGAPGAVPAVTAYVDEPLLPKVSAEDAGKVIGVDENGELKAVSAGGGGGGSFIVNALPSGEALVLDKKWSEIYAACETQSVVIIHKINAGPAEYVYVYNLIGISKEPGTFLVVAFGGMAQDTTAVFSTSTENGYPTKT